MLALWVWIVACLRYASFHMDTASDARDVLAGSLLWMVLVAAAVVWGVSELVLLAVRRTRRRPQPRLAGWSARLGYIVGAGSMLLIIVGVLAAGLLGPGTEFAVIMLGLPLAALVSWSASVGLALGIRALRVEEPSRMALVGIILNGVLLAVAVPAVAFGILLLAAGTPGGH